ncbi:hypothetical protein SALBM311S_01405 [Streptomyces alboniger]
MGDSPSAMACSAAFATSSWRLAEAAERVGSEAGFRSRTSEFGKEPVAAPATRMLAKANVRAAPRPMRRG